MTAEDPKDLVCLVADKNTEQSILTLLDRPEALAIRRVTFDILIHPEHDPGCLLRSPEFLRSLAGWRERAAAIVVDPEIDAWVWSDSPRVEAVLGWTGRDPDLRSWLRDHELLDPSSPKPGRPKEAVEKALQLVRKPRSSALYRQLAREVGLARCA